MDIDVVIDHDEMLARIIGQMTSPQRCRNLLRVTAMAFADLNAQKLGPFATPNAGHIRHTRLFQVLPCHRRERRRCPGRPFVGSPGTRASETAMKDWIVPIGDAFDPNGMLRRFTSRVVARVLTERTLGFE